MANSIQRQNAQVVTGTLNGVSNASVTGASVFIGTNFVRVDDLSAHLTITAATSSLTVTPYWQVSDNNQTFRTIWAAPQQPVNLPVATGPENITEVVPAPVAIRGYRYARCMLLVGGATGQAADMYSVGYTYREQFASA